MIFNDTVFDGMLSGSTGALVRFSGKYGAAVRTNTGISVYLPVSPDEVEKGFGEKRSMTAKVEGFGDVWPGFSFSHEKLDEKYNLIIFNNAVGAEVSVQHENDKSLQEGMYDILNCIFEGAVCPGNIDPNNKDFHPRSLKESQVMACYLNGHGNIKKLVDMGVPMPEGDEDLLDNVLDLAGLNRRDIAYDTIKKKYGDPPISYSIGEKKIIPSKIDLDGVKGNIYSSVIRFGLPNENCCVSGKQKMFGLGVALAGLRKDNNIHPRERELSNNVLGLYAMTYDVEECDYRKVLRENKLPNCSVAPLSVLAAMQEKSSSWHLDIVRAIWKANYTNDQVGEVVEGIESGKIM
jgi:hypothetical protein